MSYRVQARDSRGNVFAMTTAREVDVALALARAWIELHPGLTIEVTRDYE